MAMFNRLKDSDVTGGNQTRKERVEEYIERLELLYDVAEKASSITAVSRLIEEMLKVTQRTLNASASSLFMIEPEKNQLYVKTAAGDESLKLVNPEKSSGIAGLVATEGVAALVPNASSDRHFNADVDKATGASTESLIAAPIFRGRKVIGVVEVLNKADGRAFTSQDLQLMTALVTTEAMVLLVSMAATAITNILLANSRLEGSQGTIEALIAAAEARDPYAIGHSQRVKKYSLYAADALKLSPAARRAIECGALLHDIGKIGVSESILRKTEPLTTEELYIIRKHPFKGASIVGEIQHLQKAREIILNHHERYDGKGYPEGLKGEQIPLGARLVAVADAFDTMITDHSYRPAMSENEAMGQLIDGMHTQFCPVAVKSFMAGYKKYANAFSKANDEAKKAREAEKLTREEAEQAVKEMEKQAQDEKGTGGCNQHLVQVLIPPLGCSDRVKQFQEGLEKTECVRIISTGGSEEGTIIVIAVDDPVDIIDLLNGLPMVNGVEKKGKRVVVSLCA